MRIHPIYWLLLRRPDRVDRHLDLLVKAGRLERRPTLWQVWMGVMYMLYRVAYRSETIGVPQQEDPVRRTLRARLLSYRPLRFPFLVWERVINPFDFTGLVGSPEFIIRHLLGAYHPGDNAVFDLAILSGHPGRLEELASRARAIVAGADPKAEWLRDLTVHEGYHERLLELAERCLAGDFSTESQGAVPSDETFEGFMAWCMEQPRDAASTLKAALAGQVCLDPTRPAQGALA